MKKTILISILSVALLLGCKGNTSPAQKKLPTDVETMVASQSAQGAKQSNMDIAFLENIEKWTVDMYINKTIMQPELAGRVIKEELGKWLTHGATYINIGDRKLAIVKIKATPPKEKPIFSSFIIGIDDNKNEIKKVTCISLNEFPVTSGKCGQTVEQTFNVKFPTKQ